MRKLFLRLMCLFGKHKYEEITVKEFENIYDCDNFFAGEILVEKTYLRCRYCGKKIKVAD